MIAPTGPLHRATGDQHHFDALGAQRGYLRHPAGDGISIQPLTIGSQQGAANFDHAASGVFEFYALHCFCRAGSAHWFDLNQITMMGNAHRLHLRLAFCLGCQLRLLFQVIENVVHQRLSAFALRC